MDNLCNLCLVFVLHLRLCLFIAALWSPAGKKADLLVLICDLYCALVTFSCGILRQVWYLIV